MVRGQARRKNISVSSWIYRNEETRRNRLGVRDIMDYKRILEGILDIGEAMLCSGAENFRLDDTLYRMCKSYGFKRYDVFAIPSNIQITVETPEGEILTQIRHIESTGINYDRLDYLNNLARYVCKNTPDAGRNA